MKNIFYFLMLSVVYNNSIARLYSNLEIKNYQQINTNLVKQKFINDFSRAETSEIFIINSIQKSNNPLNLESNLNNLLEYIRSQPKSLKNQDLINQLKSYQPRAMKLHDEGSLEIPIYNIQANVQGIENYWSFLETKKMISDDLNVNYLLALGKVKLILAGQHEAQILALKKSINIIDENTKKQLSLHFLNNILSISGIEKFVIDFAVIHKDKFVIDKLIEILSLRQSEYLTRQLVDNFNQTYVIEKLIQQVQVNNANRLSLTLLKPYVNSDLKVQQFLMESLKNKKLASAAAFSLSNLSDENMIKRLKSTHSKSGSNHEKNSILLALKLNSDKSAQAALKQIMVEK